MTNARPVVASDENPPKPEEFGATPDLYESDYEAYLDKYRAYKLAYYAWVRENGFQPGCGTCS